MWFELAVVTLLLLNLGATLLDLAFISSTRKMLEEEYSRPVPNSIYHPQSSRPVDPPLHNGNPPPPIVSPNVIDGVREDPADGVGLYPCDGRE